MINKKPGKYADEEEINELQKVESTKVLGYQMNRHNSCEDHIIKLKNKVSKVQRMIFLAGKNEIDKWKRLYIFMQYTMSLLNYGSHQLFVTKNNLDKMTRSVDFNEYKALIVK